MNQLSRSLSDKYKEFVVEQNQLDFTKNKVNSNVLVVDGLNTFIRTFSIVPTMDDNGNHVGGITGTLRSIGKAIRDTNATRCIIVWDGKGGSTSRRKMFSDYKSGRKPLHRLNRMYEGMEDSELSLRRQLLLLVSYINLLPVSMISIDGMEADDIIANICKECITGVGENTIIMSTDEDFLQLINNRTSVYNPHRKILYDIQIMYDKYGIHANNFLLYKILSGDKSDNINGIRGMGMETLKKRFPFITDSQSHTIKDIIDHAKSNDTGKIKLYAEVSDSWDLLKRNYDLMQLHDPNISGLNKLKISDIVNEPINKLNKHVFLTKLHQDRMWDAFRNAPEWIHDTFTTLNSFS